MKCYALNLPRSTDRRAHILKQCEKHGFTPHFVAGGDREDWDGFPEDYNPEKAQAAILRQMGLGEIGCLLGHLRAYQRLIDSGDEWAVIIEDDAHLISNPLEELAGFDGKLVLGVLTETQNEFRRKIAKRVGNGILKLDEAPYGGYCYAIHRKFAAEAIAHLRQGLHMPIDVYFRHRSREKPNGGFWQVEGVAQESSIGVLSVIGDEARMAGRSPDCMRALETSHKCPAIIHQIWLGTEQTYPAHTWARHNPFHIHKVWREADLLAICEPYGMREIVSTYLDLKMYPAAADIGRLCILHRFGGFYADADSECQRQLDIDTPFLCWESEKYRPGLLMNGFLQLKARSPIMLDCLDRVRKLKHPVEPHRVWQDLGPQLLTDEAEKYDIPRLHSSHFVPVHFEGLQENPVPAPYSIHTWGSTHKDA